MCTHANTWSRLALLPISVSLLRSAITCLRGARSLSNHYDRAPPPMDLVRVESHLMDQSILAFIGLFVCF